MAVAETIAKTQSQTLDLVTNFQTKVVELNRDLAGSVLATVPSTATPILDKVWDPALVDQAFAFTGQLLEANRAFTANLIAAWLPAKAAAKK